MKHTRRSSSPLTLRDRLRKACQGEYYSDDLLEAYAFKRMAEPELARLEQHLLTCATCRSRLSEIELHIAVMKAALVESGARPSRRIVE